MLLARRQPVVSDLRLVITVIEVVANLERMGDCACNIGEYVIYIASGRDVRHVGFEQAKRDARRASWERQQQWAVRLRAGARPDGPSAGD